MGGVRTRDGAVEDDLGCSGGDPKKIKTLCHSKMKEGAVRRCYFDLRLIPSTSSVARASFKPVVARITLIRGLTIRACWEGQHFSYRLICTFASRFTPHNLRGGTDCGQRAVSK